MNCVLTIIWKEGISNYSSLQCGNQIFKSGVTVVHPEIGNHNIKSSSILGLVVSHILTWGLWY
jgi:hypothetical protein